MNRLTSFILAALLLVALSALRKAQTSAPGQIDRETLDKWYMSYIAFNGQGYNSFVAESTDLVKWTNPRLALGFGKEGEFDFGGCRRDLRIRKARHRHDQATPVMGH